MHKTCIFSLEFYNDSFEALQVAILGVRSRDLDRFQYVNKSMCVIFQLDSV